jgi:hypothetical protein
MKLAQVVAVVGLIVSLLTIGAFIYTAGRSQERSAAALRKLCEHVLVLEQIAISEHPAYSASIYVNKGCDE